MPTIDRRALAEVFQDPRTLLAIEKLIKQAFEVNPGDIATALNAPNFVGEFAGVGDGGTNNDAAFAAAEASSFAEIYLPDGVFVSTMPQSAFNKHYVGPGKISISGFGMPGHFSYIASTPAIWPTQGYAGFFLGGTEHVDPEWFVIGPGTRDYLTNSRYFEAPFIPHPVFFDVRSGSAGILTRTSGALALHATTAVLTSADGVSVGQLLGMTGAGVDGAFTDFIKIDTLVGTTITFHCTTSAGVPLGAPGLANAYASGAVLMLAHRSWAGAYYLKTTNYSGGDAYGAIWRLQQNYVPLAGQTHFFETSTAGQAGGDVVFGAGSSGTYATGWESMYTDGGNDVAVIAQVDTFNRTNDTGARSTVWLGNFFVSAGSVPADAAYVAAGKWRIGLDTVRADLTNFAAPGDNLNIAINTALGHRWVMNSTASNAGRGGSTNYSPFFGNAPGDMYVESGHDTGDFMGFRFNRAFPNNGILRLRPGAVVANVPYLTSLGLGVWGSGGPGSQPSITGALSTVTDAAAKAVLTSIINALVSYGLVSNATT